MHRIYNTACARVGEIGSSVFDELFSSQRDESIKQPQRRECEEA